MSNNSDDVFVEDIRLIADDLSDFYDELEGKTVNVAGRVMAIRKMGKASFAQIMDSEEKVFLEHILLTY